MKVFKTKADCTAYLDGLVESGHLVCAGGYYYQSGQYVLSHGEYDRADYKPQRYKDGWRVKQINHFYPGTCYARQDGPVSLYVDDYGLAAMSDDDLMRWEPVD